MAEVIEELYSTDNCYKAEIHRRADALLEILTFKWTHEIVKDYGDVCPPFWERLPGGPSITDDLSSARALAVEELQRCSGENGWKTAWSSPREEPIAKQVSIPPSRPIEGTVLPEIPLKKAQGGPEATASGNLPGSILGMTLFVSSLTASLVTSPLVWWLYGPGWAICIALAAAALFAITPFRHLLQAVVLINLAYCTLAAGYLVFISD